MPLRTLYLSPLLALVACGSAPRARQPAAECVPEVVAWLADDAREGRGVGTPGLEQAADWLGKRMEAIGLEAHEGSFFQPFEATTGVALGPGNALSAGDETLSVSDDFTPFGFSDSGSFEGDLVFVGYGIRAAPLEYDDYAGVDVKGKIALAMRYEPGEDDEASPFDGKRSTRWSDLRDKAMRAREAGAVALILVTGPAGASPGEEERLPALKSSGPISRAGIPVIQVTRATAEAWLASAGLDLAALQSKIDTSYAPASAPVTGVRLTGTVDVVSTKAPVRNVIGVWPGQGALADEVVVVGAHYDHLGHGGHGSMAPDSDAIHNGADDNASGTAAVLCAMDGLMHRDGLDGDRRTVVAMAFTAEEIGLGGSGWYANNPLFAIEHTVAMVNLDMVGRVRDGKVQALGTDSAAEWTDLIGPEAERVGLDVATGGDGYGPSDQMSFFEKRVPVVHLFSGSHEQYHTPDDDADTLNYEGTVQVVDLLEGLVAQLATREGRLTFQESKGGPMMAGDSRGYGSYLGTIPDYTTMMEPTGGVLLSGVREGGPAEKAGMKQGDRLVGMAGVEIQNLYDMTFVLRDHKPGDTVDVVVLRDGAEVRLKATLDKRPASGEGGHGATWKPAAGKAADDQIHPDEKHLSELRQLTFDGENAEAYFSPDGRTLIFQRTGPDGGCDQQYTMDLTTGAVERLSSGRGRTTCGYYDYPAGERFIYATTEAASPDCPPAPDHSQGYVWALYPGFDLVWHAPGGEPEPFLATAGYDAEATTCQKDGRVIFTSTRDGDLELYTVNRDGSELRRITHTPGYDGGAYFSHDCEHLVWRASRPEGEALADYERLLAQDLVRPSALELYWSDADGSNVKQLTDNGAANFGPYPTPDDKGVIFSSNLGGDAREFDLHLVDVDGLAVERVTYTEGFDGFPMFSPDGRYLVFASNRADPKSRVTNLYIARWKAGEGSPHSGSPHGG